MGKIRSYWSINDDDTSRDNEWMTSIISLRETKNAGDSEAEDME